MQTSIPANPSRAYYLDNLKVWLTVLVIFHHVSAGYGGGTGWVYVPSDIRDCDPWLSQFLILNAAFTMGLYFLISGYFVPKSFDKHGAKDFMWKKILRLGVPMVVMTGIMSLFSRHLEVGHMWFLQHLLVYSLVYAVVRMLIPRTISKGKGKQPTVLMLLGLAIVIGIYGYLIRPLFPQDWWVLLLGFIRTEFAHLFQYIVLFTVGIISCRQNWFERMSRSTGVIALAVGIALLTIYYINPYDFTSSLWGNGQRYLGVFEGFLSVFLSFGLVFLFRELYNKTTKFRQWASAQAYCAFIIHIPIVVGIQNAFDKIYLGGGTMKFLVIGIIVTSLSFGISALVRKIPGAKSVL